MLGIEHSRNGFAPSDADVLPPAEPVRARPTPKKPRAHRKVLADLALLVAATVFVFLLAGQHDWFREITRWVMASPLPDLDEALIAAIFLACGLTLFAFRRWREAQSQLARRKRMQAELEALRDSLAERVRERTHDLSDANDVLSREVAQRKKAQEVAAASEARYRQLFDASPMPMWVYDLKTLAFLAVNDAAIASYGYSREQFLRMTIREIRPARELPRLEANLRSEGKNFDHSGVWDHRRADGATIKVEITSHVLEFEGRPAKLVAATDISGRMEQEHRIARLSRIRAVIGGVSSAMLRLHDRDELLHEACRVSCIEGVFPAAWVVAFDAATEMPQILAFHSDEPGSIELVRTGFAKIPLQHMPSYRAAQSGLPVIVNDIAAEEALAPMREELMRRELRACAAFPLIVGEAVSAVMVLLAREAGFFDEEETALVQWLTGDISYALAHIDKSRRLDRLAYYDALTGLANAHLFRDRLDQFVFAARQNHGVICVVVADIEHFTQINDSFGRGVGDKLLRDVGERLHQCLIEPYTLGRIGADTFAIASPVGDTVHASRLRDGLLAALMDPFEIDGHTIGVSAQAGVALYPADGDDGSSLFKNAEIALKLAKSSGEPYVYYSRDMQARIARRVALEAELRTAIERQQFVLHYQARIDIVSGEAIGAEALIRWQHPTRGLISPGEFIGLAEETGMIVPIGGWVIDQVCAQLATWIAAGVPVVPIAVNVSSIQLEKSDLVELIRLTLARHALSPKWLELELTESAVMADPEAAIPVLKRLHELGVRLALDDFGTGYSSLAHLKRFPFHMVKIDQSFVVNITSNPEDAAIASAIIAMAHRLSLKVVAEGVETAGQLNHLRGEGCDGMQGYLFSGAVSAREFEGQLLAGKRISLPKPDAAEQTLLLVDDEPGIRSALNRTLRRDGYKILTASSGAEALDLLALNSVQVIISDQRMPEMSGTEFLNIVKQLYPDTLRIILSGFTDLQVVTDSVNRGAVYKFLTKPWDDELLRDQVRDAFRRFRPEQRRL